MLEGSRSGSGSIPLTSGSGSATLENTECTNYVELPKTTTATTSVVDPDSMVTLDPDPG